MSKESIALQPVVRPKNNQQFMAKRLPYWKTAKYKNFIANGGTEAEYLKGRIKNV